MSEVEHILSETHKIESQVGGQIAIAIATHRVRGKMVWEWAARLRQASDMLERLAMSITRTGGGIHES